MMPYKIDKMLVTITLVLFTGVALAVGLTASPAMGAKVFIDTQGQPTVGSLAAPVEVVVFEDMKCVWCARFTTEIYPKLKENYISTGKVRYTMVPLAFLAGSKPAGNAVLEVWDQNKELYFDYVEAIYASQPPETQNWATTATLQGFAQQVPQVDQDALAKAVKEGRWSKQLDANLLLAKRVMKDDFGTPTVYVNGQRVSQLTYDTICDCIEQVIKESSGE